MKKLWLLLVLTLCLSGCAQQEEAVEVYAAASLTAVMDTLIEAYEADHDNVTITATYDSSGTLRRQIQEGAHCDIFFSASLGQVKEVEGTMTPLLENQLVLVVPEGADTAVDFATLQAGDIALMAIGNSDVPAGAYAMEVLESLDISLDDLEAQGKISYGSNVKEVLTQVEEHMVDCAMVYATDAVGSTVQIVAVADGSWYSPAIYPMVVLNDEDATQAFAEFLQSDAAGAVFEAAGFALVG